MAALVGIVRSLIVAAAVVATVAGHADQRDVGAVVPEAPKAQQAPRVPDVLSGDWGGIYQCRQGQTAVSVSLSLQQDGGVSGTFTFGNLPGRSNAKDGAYRIIGTFDDATNRLKLSPNGWINQPAGYQQVGLTATLDRTAQRLNGKIESDGCSKITIDKVPN